MHIMVEIMKSDRSSERYEVLGNNSGVNQQMHPLSSANPPNLPRPPIHPSQQQHQHQQQQQQQQQQQHNHHMVQQQPQQHPLQHNNHGLAPHNHNLSSIHLNSTPGTARSSQNQPQQNGSGLGAKYEELVMSNSASTATNHHHHHHHHNNSPLQRPPLPMHHANGAVNGGGGYGVGSVSDTTGVTGGGNTPSGNISANGVTVVNGQTPAALEPGYAAEQENEKWWWVCCLEFCFCLL